jgi:protein ImuB
MFACIHVTGEAAALLECAQGFSPVVELTSPKNAVLDVSGLERLYGSPHHIAAAMSARARQMGMEANVAVAANPDAAACAARGFSGIHVVPFGDEAKYLGSLPLALLSPDPEIFETLERWGIRTFHDLAALPEVGIAERLGPGGVRLRKLAAGAFDRPLRPYEDPLQFREEMELEYPVSLLEPLLFILARLLNDLCARMSSRGCATTELRARLTLEGGGEHGRALKVPVAMRNARAFLKLLHLDLEAHPPQAPVLKVVLEADPVKPRLAQHGLFLPIAPEPEKLELTLARIAALVGEENVGSPELVDTHRPDAFRMKSFAAAPQRGAPCEIEPRITIAFRAYRPPLAAGVSAPSGEPLQVQAQGIRGRVITAAGPWRTSGDWWRSDEWARDEWDIALNDGGVYRICCHHATGRWYVEGSYD